MNEMKTIFENTPWLKPWQRRAIIIIGAVAGGLAAVAVVRYAERRRQSKKGAA